jgi:hypothetical protein
MVAPSASLKSTHLSFFCVLIAGHPRVGLFRRLPPPSFPEAAQAAREAGGREGGVERAGTEAAASARLPRQTVSGSASFKQSSSASMWVRTVRE